MAYTEPTPETFKARYPEFAPVNDALIQLVLNEAVGEVGETWMDRDRARAQMLLVAHRLTLEGEPDRTNTGSGAAGIGAIKRDKVGDSETEFFGPTGSSSDATGSGLSLTAYGREYLALLRKNFAAVAVV